MTRSDILAILRAENVRGRPDDMTIYADAFLAYVEAARNIDKHGNIVAHPRTGEPIENPYLKIRVQASNEIRKIKLKTGALWDDIT